MVDRGEEKVRVQHSYVPLSSPTRPGERGFPVTRLHMLLFGYTLFRFTSESSFFRACKIYIIHRRLPSETFEMYLYFELLTEQKTYF